MVYHKFDAECYLRFSCGKLYWPKNAFDQLMSQVRSGYVEYKVIILQLFSEAAFSNFDNLGNSAN